MTRRSKVWLVVASIFTFINFVGAGSAVADGEVLHTIAHVGLTLLGAFFVWRLARRPPMHSPLARQADERLEQLQQTVDAIALDVERIGEAQRFIAKLAAERTETPPR